MSVPLPVEPCLTVAGLAQAWARVASRTTYLPMSGDEIEQLLTRMINRLVTAAATAPVDERAAIEVAAELVAHNLTGLSSIGRSIEILGEGLPRLAPLRHIEGRDAAVLRVLGALAGGYTEVRQQRTFDEQGQLMKALLQAKLEAERELRFSEARFRQVFSEAAVGIAISDLDGTLIAVNRAFTNIVGRAREDLIGVTLPELLQTEEDPTLGKAYHELISGEVIGFRRRGQLKTANGEEAWAILGGSLLRDPDEVPTHHIIIVEDITELHLLQQRLSHQTLHDMLTGLPNEHYFMSRLHDVLEGADPSTLITVCRVNLDNFAVINDGIGRDTGGKLLNSVAQRLQDLVIGDRAMVARMGTDDFAILIENGMDNRDLSMFAANINIQLSEPVYFDDRGIAVSAGVGVVCHRAGEITSEELIRVADSTLHRAKRTGRGQWGLEDPPADAEERERYRLAAEIPGAWENGEITLLYQPVYALDSELIVALQALLRWDRADGSVVDHADCLALAEQTGLLIHLGRWMFHEACRQQIVVSARSTGEAPRMRVDLTGRLSQDPDLVTVVNGVLSDTGLAAEELWIGVPLPTLVRARGEVVENVGVLADLGAQVVLLGAGAGPGYMGYLEDLRVDAIEIAPAAVARIAQRPGDESLVAQAMRRLLPLARDAVSQVIVPDVDTAEQVAWWRSAGAHSARGAHFGPPLRWGSAPLMS